MVLSNRVFTRDRGARDDCPVHAQYEKRLSACPRQTDVATSTQGNSSGHDSRVLTSPAPLMLISTGEVAILSAVVVDLPAREPRHSGFPN